MSTATNASPSPPVLTFCPATRPETFAKRKRAHASKRVRQKPYLVRIGKFVCSQCGVRDTPETRRGPCGPNTLCNACGLLYANAQARFIENSRKMTNEQLVKQAMAIARILCRC